MTQYIKRLTPKQRARKPNNAQVTVATAHAIARVVYRMLTLAPPASAGEYKVEYEQISVEEYEQKYKDQQLKYMNRVTF